MHNGGMLSPGKSFTDPFFLAVVMLSLTLLYARIRTTRDKLARRALTFALFVTIAIGGVGTEVAVRLLERSLRVERESGIPAVIVVPSRGSKENVLVTASAERVVTAVEWWKEHPTAHVLMSGGDRPASGSVSARSVRLMRELAILYGVPPDRVGIEPRSFNTRLHPIELLREPGIRKSTPIGVVTSATHMRRARSEFRKHFDRVIAHPVIEQYPPLNTDDFIPSAEALAGARAALHEWIGIAWYALRP